MMERGRRFYFDEFGNFLHDTGEEQGLINPVIKYPKEFDGKSYIDLPFGYQLGQDIKAIRQDVVSKELLIDRFTQVEKEANWSDLDKIINKKITFESLTATKKIEIFKEAVKRLEVNLEG